MKTIRCWLHFSGDLRIRRRLSWNAGLTTGLAEQRLHASWRILHVAFGDWRPAAGCVKIASVANHLGRLLSCLSCLALAAGDLEAAEVVLRGRVVDEKEAPVAGALIVARPVASVAGEASAESREAHSGLEGDFILTLPDEGD